MSMNTIVYEHNLAKGTYAMQFNAMALVLTTQYSPSSQTDIDMSTAALFPCFV